MPPISTEIQHFFSLQNHQKKKKETIQPSVLNKISQNDGNKIASPLPIPSRFLFLAMQLPLRGQ